MNLTELVSEFCAGHLGETVTATQLHQFVSGRVPCTPGSESRILRKLKDRGAVSYTVSGRNRNEYTITGVY